MNTTTRPKVNHRLHRCPSCGCQVTAEHEPNSPACDAAWEERRWSRYDE